MKRNEGYTGMHQVNKNEPPESHENLYCPFCLNQEIQAEPGKIRCPVCDAGFKIDDRVECVSGDTENLKLPAVGIICAVCGLVQAGNNPNCLYCGTEINKTVQ